VTQKQWERLRQERPDLKLVDWYGLGSETEKRARRLTKDQVIAELVAYSLTGEEHAFTFDVPF